MPLLGLELGGISATVVNMHTLKPFDSNLVLKLAAGHEALITVENRSIVSGLGSAVAETLAMHGVDTRFAALSVADVFAEGGSSAYLFQKYGFDTSRIVATALDLRGRPTRPDEH